MVEESVLFKRIAVGKTLGGLVGLLGFGLLSAFESPVSFSFKLGIVFWYVLLGALVSLQASVDFGRVIRFSIPWWLGAVWVGAGLNFILLLFVATQIEQITAHLIPTGAWLHHPLWFVLEGSLIGLAIAAVTRRL